ncbi:MAG: hypothetical protein AAF265_07335, partial [Pseudomonadota bacterium]
MATSGLGWLVLVGSGLITSLVTSQVPRDTGYFLCRQLRICAVDLGLFIDFAAVGVLTLSIVALERRFEGENATKAITHFRIFWKAYALVLLFVVGPLLIGDPATYTSSKSRYLEIYFAVLCAVTVQHGAYNVVSKLVSREV